MNAISKEVYARRVASYKESQVSSDVTHVKSMVLDCLVFGVHDYGSPYRNIEKGLLLLHTPITEDSLSTMLTFILKASFYDLYKESYLRDPVKLHHDITSMDTTPESATLVLTSQVFTLISLRSQAFVFRHRTVAYTQTCLEKDLGCKSNHYLTNKMEESIIESPL
ncbi:hypothetical protein BCR41DRAFT_374370 [Lobosporangium transversale]|uniref:Uncharacterized protein n=1 Tax=Lobosporangium transversale TaxID=64571 RepID=A0A1Y2GB03_9FUNG|nr:hypothetical protein BCR41DRAFT_374370 [Lobosporangium transversale]ORZ05738.1 hypothetical protein BCR41DRAFT_374370 [Lobosporangium transversale]|eukprot:XP_021877225.1 hypothetical protein BCR41DRAFT_374370 [Lobosporangium transversale]